ncbi:hypothetical protein D1007_59674 [Hordeum vulgare]|nr:hypothetical protein D1007_59674 [Hordeum vulgare]
MTASGHTLPAACVTRPRHARRMPRTAASPRPRPPPARPRTAASPRSRSPPARPRPRPCDAPTRTEVARRATLACAEAAHLSPHASRRARRPSARPPVVRCACLHRVALALAHPHRGRQRRVVVVLPRASQRPHRGRQSRAVVVLPRDSQRPHRATRRPASRSRRIRPRLAAARLQPWLLAVLIFSSSWCPWRNSQRCPRTGKIPTKGMDG